MELPRGANLNPLLRSTTAEVGSKLKVWVGTWNMGNAEPELDELKQWLPNSDTDKAKYDLVVLGVQESTFLSSAKGRISVNTQIRRESVKFVGELDAAKLKKQVNVANKGGRSGDNEEIQPIEHSEETRQKKQKTPSEEVEDMVRELERNKDLDGTQATSSTKAKNKNKETSPALLSTPTNVTRRFSKEARGSKIIKDEDISGLLEETSHAEKLAKSMKAFDAMIQATLGFHYRTACSENLGPMKLVLFMNVAHKGRLHNVHKHTEATGLFHLLPNKGGILISVTIDGLKLCFVSAHLNAQHDNLKSNPYERNDDVTQIFRSKQKFDIPVLPVYMQHHHTIFMGDLNYRLDLRCGFNNKAPKIDYGKVLGENHRLRHSNLNNLPNDQDGVTKHSKKDSDRVIAPEKEWKLVNDFVENIEKNKHTIGKLEYCKKYIQLLKYDELNAHRNAGLVFTNFKEGEIRFPPTFKCELGVNSFKYTEHKHRTPSYCDRILFTSRPGFEDDISQTTLNACKESTTSDHKPSYSTFSIATPNKIKLLDHSVARLKISNLGIINLKGGDKDMFVRFYSSPNNLFKKMKVGKIKSEVPRTAIFFPSVPLDDSQIPILHCNLDDADKLSDCSIIFALIHHDTILKESLGEHDLHIAYGQLSLREVAQTTGNGDKASTCNFRIKLTLNSQDCEGEDLMKPAYLEGEMRVIWDILEDVPEGQFAQDLANVSDGCGNGCCEVQ
jgi:hypothetical protein